MLCYQKTNRWTQQTAQTGVATRTLCVLVVRFSPCFLPHHQVQKLHPGRMLDFLVSSSVSFLSASEYLYLCFAALHPTISPTFGPSIFPFTVSSASCVLLHSFSLCFLSWGIFASRFPLDSSVTNADQIVLPVPLTIASPLAADGALYLDKRFCESYGCRFGEVRCH